LSDQERSQNNMSNIFDDFQELNEYFESNYKRIQTKHTTLVGEFRSLYDKIATDQGTSLAHQLTPQQGTALAIIKRALKFTYVSFDLTLKGHTQEARILLRNVEELKLVALDIATDSEAYDVWRIAQKEKEKIKKDNIIDSKKLKQQIIEDYGLGKGKELLIKMNVKSSIKRLRRKKDVYLDSVVNKAINNRLILSEFVSHENIFNLVRRIDAIRLNKEHERIDIYIGMDADSPKIGAYLRRPVTVLKELYRAISFIKDGI